MPRALLAEKLGREIALYVDLLIVFPIPRLWHLNNKPPLPRQWLRVCLSWHLDDESPLSLGHASILGA